MCQALDSHPSLVSLVNGTPCVSSLDIAERFGKRHDHVIRDIREICANLPETFTAPNFGESFREVETGNGTVRKFPCYSLTRDAFSLLAMGFTGKEALAWKVRYIEAFNAVEKRAPAPEPFEPSRWPLPLKMLSASARHRLSDVVNAKLADVPQHIFWKARCNMWAAFNQRFAIQRYELLPEERMPDAVLYLDALEVLPSGKVRVRREDQFPLPFPPAPSVQEAIRNFQVMLLQGQRFITALAAAQEPCGEVSRG